MEMCTFHPEAAHLRADYFLSKTHILASHSVSSPTSRLAPIRNAALLTKNVQVANKSEDAE